MHDRFFRHTRPAALLALGLTLMVPLMVPLTSQAADALRVVRDPVTGELRGPTAAEVTAFQKAEEQLRLQQQQQQLKQGGSAAVAPVKTPTEIQHPDGSVELQLGEDSQLFSVVRAKEDGTLDMQCLPAQQAKAYVKGSRKQTTAKAAARNSAVKGHEGHNHE